jgi:hypothetical protein
LNVDDVFSLADIDSVHHRHSNSTPIQNPHSTAESIFKPDSLKDV